MMAEHDAAGNLTMTTHRIPVGEVVDIGFDVRGSALPSVGNRKCYARDLGNCTGISREHIISESVLALFPDKFVNVRASPGLPAGRSYRKSISALKWPVLCARHNSQLLSVDDVGVEFFRPVYEALTARRAKDVQSLRLDGLKIERWLLKVACGIAAASSRSEVVSEAPREWVEILFGQDHGHHTSHRIGLSERERTPMPRDSKSSLTLTP